MLKTFFELIPFLNVTVKGLIYRQGFPMVTGES